MHQQNNFVQLIKKNQGIIYKVTRIYASGIEDQKDLYQEIVFQLWKSFASFRQESKITTWMYRVALNTSIAHLQKEHRKSNALSTEFPLPEITDDQDRSMEERLAIMHEQIKLLNVIEKGIILLYLEGNSYQEIAQITGFTVSNIGTRLGRIKLKLKHQIKEKELWN